MVEKWLELGKNAFGIDAKHYVLIHKATFTDKYWYIEVCIDTKSKICFQSPDLKAYIDTPWICTDTQTYVSIHSTKNHKYSYCKGLYRNNHDGYRYISLGLETKSACIDTTHKSLNFWWCKNLVSTLMHWYNLHILVASWVILP